MTNRIKELRNEKGMTQSELGDVLGVKQSAIKKYELSEVNIPQDKITMLADYFECSIDYLLGKSEYRTEQDVFEATMAAYSHSKTETGEWVYDKNALTANEKKLITYFRGFNQEGQEKALDLLDDMAASGKYIKTGSLGMVVEEKQA